MNELAMTTKKIEAVNTVYNTAFGDRTTLNDLVRYLKESLAEHDPEIASVQVIYGPNRAGDIPHSLASIDKAKELLGYNPRFSMQQGLKEAVNWYWHNLQ
jgi:UDP-N-acetylglucosamine 4-epimerase